MDKFPISAIVVGYNEAHFLKNALKQLAFCDQILYFDLGSEDGSVQIAKDAGAEVIIHEKVSACEIIHAEYAKKTKHKWVLITDPDEVIQDETISSITKLFSDKLNEDTGCVYASIFYLFKNQQLTGTIWGGRKHRLLLAHNERFDFLPMVHSGRHLKDGFNSLTIDTSYSGGIKHYWSNSFRSLFAKHKRYLLNEGQSRFNVGQRTTLKEVLLKPIKAFRSSYIILKGYRDGANGFFLSIFWAWYETSAHLKLLRYQQKQGIK